MALDNSAKMVNMKRSLDLYCHTNLKTTEGLNVDFEGLPFDNIEVQSWIQPRMIGYSGKMYPSGASGQYAEDLNILFQVNIFTKKSGSTNTLQHYAIRDMVANHFRLGQDIPLYDYNSSGVTTALLANFRVRNVANDMPVPETNELNQYVYAVDMQWTRLTTKP